MEKVIKANKNLYLSIIKDKDRQNKANFNNGMISLYEYATINKTITFGRDIIEMSLFVMKDFSDKVEEYISGSPFETEKEILEIISTYINNCVTLAEFFLKGEIDLTLNEMGFIVEKVTVGAKTRALKAEFSIELVQDLKAIHGFDAENENNP